PRRRGRRRPGNPHPLNLLPAARSGRPQARLGSRDPGRHGEERAMVSFGYTVMGEQAGPKQLVADARRAEAAGFDFIAASDHYFPWRSEEHTSELQSLAYL